MKNKDNINEELQYAKEAVVWLIEHSSGLVDMHGLLYWAEKVNQLRDEIKKSL